MIYNSYFFQCSIFCLFRIFWGVCKCCSVLSCHCWKQHLGSETVPSATHLRELWSILVFRNNFFFMQVESLPAKMFDFYWNNPWILSLICNVTRICPLRNPWLLVDIFSLNKHMGLLSLNLIKIHTCQGHAIDHGSSVIHTI